MQLPQGASVAVVDGEKFAMFRNTGTVAEPKLTAVPDAEINDAQWGADTGHSSSAANPDESQDEEDGFAKGVADHLNKLAIADKLSDLVVIAAPRTLGSLRKHYHVKLEQAVLKELSKDLTGHTTADIEKAIAAA